MIQTQELSRQILCRFSNEVYKQVKKERFGIKTCKNSLPQEDIDELFVVKDLLPFIEANPNRKTSCDINKLLQNINYL